MINTTFKSQGTDFKIEIYPGPVNGKKYPIVIVLHGNWGLNPPFASQIRNLAQEISKLGYVSAVPQYYSDNSINFRDTKTKENILADAITFVGAQAGSDPDKIGLVGYSLGAATAMAFIAAQPPDTVEVFIDFFGFLPPGVRSEISKFPPTIIFHNERDWIVDIENSRQLNTLLKENGIDCNFEPAKYKELNLLYGNHPFREGGSADISSRKETKEWLLEHMPPTGSAS